VLELYKATHLIASTSNTALAYLQKLGTPEAKQNITALETHISEVYVAIFELLHRHDVPGTSATYATTFMAPTAPDRSVRIWQTIMEHQKAKVWREEYHYDSVRDFGFHPPEQRRRSSVLTQLPDWVRRQM
jgi:hypothetical protein